jgi:antitoxin (DNA-binding transcriptional repressor) of toxin-antitoxin stability system
MNHIRTDKTAAPTKHLEKARGMKRTANKRLRRERHDAPLEAVMETMQTYSIESSKADLSILAHLAAKGQEVLLTENNQPLAKIVPLDEDEAYRRDVRALRGFAKGMPPFEREEDEERG